MTPDSSRPQAAERVFIAAGVLLLIVGSCAAYVSLTRPQAYTGEKLLWKAKQSAKRVLNESGGMTPEHLAAARAAYAHVIENAPGTRWAARAQMAIGSLFAAEADYTKAREAYTTITRDYAAFRTVALAARVATAHTFKIEKNWEGVAQTYQGIAEHDPWSTEGMAAPLRAAWIYAEHGQPEQAEKAFDEAQRRYTKLIDEAHTSALEELARRYLEETKLRKRLSP